jgi:hypothetical protein
MALIEEPEAVTFTEPVVPVIIDEPVVRFAEQEPEPVAMLEPLPEPLPARMPEPPPEPLAFEAAPEFSEAADAFAAEEEEIALDTSWDEIVLEEEESDHSVELTSEAIDIEKFVAELNGSVVSEFVEALEVLEATQPNAVVEDEPTRPGVHSEADSELWMPLSLTAAWPQLEGGATKAVPAAAPAEPASAPDRGRRKKASAQPLQDEWGLFDPEQCGFAALLAKLDEIAR